MDFFIACNRAMAGVGFEQLRIESDINILNGCAIFAMHRHAPQPGENVPHAVGLVVVDALLHI